MSLFNITAEFKKELFKGVAFLVVCIACSTGVSFLALSPNSPAPAAVQAPCDCEQSAIKAGAEKNLISGTDAIADIVEEISPSVVHITTQIEQKFTHDPRQFFFEEELFKRFFGEDFRIEPPPMTRKAVGNGSGTIISSDGYILTNYHVVRNAAAITVKTKDGKEYQAKLVGKDQYSDLAVIKIEEKGLKAAKMCDSSKIRPGQWAIAIGSPQGLDNTVTLGIISAVSRDIPELSNVSFIQTDAAINPGNSGGPLLNIKGEVVGINTAIMGTAQNIGFAIPVNTAKKIVDQLKGGKQVEHPWVGIAMSSMTEELAKALGVPADTKGVVIGRVVPNSPAAKAGLMEGDIIQRIDGQKVVDAKEVQDLIKAKNVNDVINVQILRDGKMIGKQIKIGNWNMAD